MAQEDSRLQQLEALATGSSIDWRLQRLEADSCLPLHTASQHDHHTQSIITGRHASFNSVASRGDEPASITSRGNSFPCVSLLLYVVSSNLIILYISNSSLHSLSSMKRLPAKRKVGERRYLSDLVRPVKKGIKFMVMRSVNRPP